MAPMSTRTPATVVFQLFIVLSRLHYKPGVSLNQALFSFPLFGDQAFVNRLDVTRPVDVQPVGVVCRSNRSPDGREISYKSIVVFYPLKRIGRERVAGIEHEPVAYGVAR